MAKPMGAYVCPWLMWLQFGLLRAARRPVYLTPGGLVALRMPKGHGVEVRAWWPRWLILAECWWHNNSWRFTPRRK
jgi:hypothetical protein